MTTPDSYSSKIFELEARRLKAIKEGNKKETKKAEKDLAAEQKKQQKIIDAAKKAGVVV